MESFEGYQEGMAYFSTDETGQILEILIAYKGFGLDEVNWMFTSEDLEIFQESTAKAAWWRSRLLAMDVNQTVLKDVATVKPDITYSHQGAAYLFDSTDSILRFVRQGKDYALILTEISSSVDSHRSGRKSFPVLTLHFSRKELPVIRDLLSESHIEQVIESYAEQKSAIEEILTDSPEA